VTHLDTSFIVDLLREQAKRVSGPAGRLLEELGDEPLALSVFVACELEAGAARAARPDRERARVAEILASVPTVFPDDRFPATYGDILDRLLSAGHGISVMALLIATAAVVEGATLVTRNPRHFDRVPRLDVRSY
jgi:tRNA(fMet)-specific endonuclease VapC